MTLLDVSDRERSILLAGGTLNYVKTNWRDKSEKVLRDWAALSPLPWRGRDRVRVNGTHFSPSLDALRQGGERLECESLA